MDLSRLLSGHHTLPLIAAVQIWMEGKEFPCGKEVAPFRTENHVMGWVYSLKYQRLDLCYGFTNQPLWTRLQRSVVHRATCLCISYHGSCDPDPWDLQSLLLSTAHYSRSMVCCVFRSLDSLPHISVSQGSRYRRFVQDLWACGPDFSQYSRFSWSANHQICI